MGRCPFHLSQGEKRLVALASLIILPADLYILDEPTLFLDGRAAGKLYGALNTLIDRGVSLIVASHEHRFVQSIAYRIVRLAGGSATVVCQRSTPVVRSSARTLNGALEEARGSKLL